MGSSGVCGAAVRSLCMAQGTARAGMELPKSARGEVVRIRICKGLQGLQGPAGVFQWNNNGTTTNLSRFVGSSSRRTWKLGQKTNTRAAKRRAARQRKEERTTKEGPQKKKNSAAQGEKDLSGFVGSDSQELTFQPRSARNMEVARCRRAVGRQFFAGGQRKGCGSTASWNGWARRASWGKG